MNSSKYEYRFVGHGYIAPSQLEPGNMMIDVGNRLCPGVLDHHQLDAKASIRRELNASTSGLLLISTHLLPEKIDIFTTHIMPDFDAWLAIWLIQYYLEHKAFPPQCEEVVEYVTMLDTGKLNVERNDFRTPAAVAAAIPYLLKDLPDDERNIAVMIRGLELIDYIFKRLENIPEISRRIDLPYFIETGCTFEKELQLVNNDLIQYEMDLNDSSYTERTRIKLHNIQTDKNEYVDALIWKKAPRCCLHKHWARSDNQAPQGNGYILTVIPVAAKSGENWFSQDGTKGNESSLNGYQGSESSLNSSQGKESSLNSSQGSESSLNGSQDKGNRGDNKISGNKVNRNRVIISVNPNMPYNLYGLAIELERNELIKEALYYKGNPDSTRVGEMRLKGMYPRFPEAWCTNHDPWYDGRSDGYTIVDSPRRYSILSLDEISHIVGSFVIPEVKGFQCRVVFPFSFHTEKGTTGFDAICSTFKKLPALKESGFEDFNVSKEAFYPYIREYLNLDGPTGQNKHKNCRIFRINSSSCYSLIILFSYGIGFIVSDFENIAPNRDTSAQMKCGADDVLALNYKRASKPDEAAGFIAGLVKGLSVNINVDDGYVYSCISICDIYMNKEETCKTLYQVCNLKSYTSTGYSRFQDDIEYSAASSSVYSLQINNSIYYGFGKSGGCLLLKANINDDDEVRRQHQEFKTRFMTVDFLSFLLSLHQRACLISLSKRLAAYAGKSQSMNMIRKLRYFIMEFMAKGWFSQISRNELNVEIYNRWAKIFENEILFNEVNAQLKSYEDYLAAERNRKIGLISSIFVPVSVFNIFFSINMFGRSQGGELIKNIPWYGSLTALLILFLIMLGYLTVGNGRRKL